MIVTDVQRTVNKCVLDEVGREFGLDITVSTTLCPRLSPDPYLTFNLSPH